MTKAAVITRKQLGDTLLLQPLLERLGRQNGEDTALLANAAFAPLVELMPGARAPAAGERYRDLWVFEHGSKPAWRARLTPARQRHLRLLRPGYRRWYHRLVFDDIAAQPLGYEYRALRHFRACFGSDHGFRPPRLARPPAADPPSACPPGAILLNPTSAWPRKAWTADGWVALARQLDEACGLPLALIGQGGEWMARHAAAIAARCPRGTIDLVNRTSLPELLAIIAAARALVAVDGACAHIAAAFGVPVLTLFGPTRAEEWHWPSPRSLALKTSDFHAGRREPLARLPQQAVLDAARQLLAISQADG